MRVVFLAVAALLLLPVGWLTYESWREAAFEVNTPLASGLSGQWDSMRSRFRDRVRQRYPVGTPVDQLVSDLAAQGFAPAATLVSPGLTSRDADAKKVADLSAARMSVLGPSLVCNMVWVVAWDADAARRVTATHADLRGYCL